MLESVRALLEESFDYAGLFPPASLSLPEAASRFGKYLASPEAWMLGRFIVPVARLNELEETVSRIAPPGDPPLKWRISVLSGDDLPGAIPAVLAFNAHVRNAVVDCLEAQAGAVDRIRAATTWIPDGVNVYIEIPSGAGNLTELIGAARAAGCRVKIRTGGVEPQAFPSSVDVARFLHRADEAKVAFKATAGLHHAVRGDHPLTDEPGAPQATMHGFLNLLLAAAMRWSGTTPQETAALLEEREPPFVFTRKGIGWRNRWLSTEQIRSARRRLIAAIGSCSFEEPVAELKERGLIP